MSALAYLRRAEPQRTPRRQHALGAMVARWGSDVLLFVALAALATILLDGIVGDFNVDSWLALVTGRTVWQSGVPHLELLTVMSHGHRWIDQQWLSQLVIYALDRAGGLGLVGVINVSLVSCAVAGAVVAARRLGAPFRSVLAVLPICLATITPSREVRTQELAMPLFVAVVWLLARDSRTPSRRVLWCLPILALWANLHGTVTLGASLVMLRGATMLCDRRADLQTSLRAWRRPLTLLLGAPAAILITPYGASIVGYYRTTMVSSTLRDHVVEWRPLTSAPGTATAVFLLAGVAIWAFGRRPERSTAWEKLAVLAVCAMTISVVRNAVFFGLLAAVVVPLALGWTSPANAGTRIDRRRTLLNVSLVVVAALTALGTGVATLGRSDGSIQYSFQRAGLLAAVQHATRADPSLRLFAQQDFADWLLWRDPALAGRVANDVRFELLTSAQLSAINAAYDVVGPHWKHAAAGYRLLVLDRIADPAATVAFLHEPGRRVLYDDGVRVVILRSAAQAGPRVF